MAQPRIGLLPLYLELYDISLPAVRPRISAFHVTIVRELKKRGLEVVAAPVCRVRSEFEKAVLSFENANADAIVTLHLAYSPSLESWEPLALSKLPIICLDTTPTYSYGPDQDPAELMYNHGIHGVQDLCSILTRNGKAFQVEAGHWERSDVLDRVASWAHAARAASRIRNARIGRIGSPFKGMGDFAIELETLRDTIGTNTVVCDFAKLSALIPEADDPEVDSEITADLATFAADGLDPQAHRLSVRVGLALRRWIHRENLTGVTMNFLSFDRSSGVPTVPFLEASKAMARGLGYAGEGDVLTAALVGALASVHPDTTFTEMFCPDWENERIFLSHMGEMNPRLAAGKAALVEYDFPWADAENPVIAVGRFRPGRAVLVNLAPGHGERYTLIVAQVQMLDVTGEDRMSGSVHGWFRPQAPVADFLADYSRAGGTHHCALVYGNPQDQITRFGRIMGWNVVAL